MSDGRSLVIDLETFVIQVEGKAFKEKLRLKFDSLSRKFYLTVIALVVNEMKKAGKVTSIKMENHYNTLVSLNENMGRKLGSSEKKDLLGRIYRTWKVLGNLEKAEHFEIMDRGRIYFRETKEKTYDCTEEEKDNWADLFECMGSETQIRLRLSINNLGLTLEDAKIQYHNSDSPWEDFLGDIRSHAGITDDQKIDLEQRHELVSSDIIQKYLDIVTNDPRINTIAHLGMRRGVLDAGVFIKRTLSIQRGEWNEWNLNPLIEVDSIQRGILIEGDPCLGKTSLSKFLVLTLAQNFPIKHIIPFWVSLHDYSNDTKESLLSYALSNAARNANFMATEKTTFINTMNQNRAKILLFLDGLDEVVKNRVKVINEIASLPTGVKFVIMTRKSEHAQDVLIEKKYSLEPLGHEEVEAYANHIFKNSNSPPEVITAFMSKLNKSRDVYELARCPFFLEIMCLKIMNDNIVPSRKTDMYQFLSKWILNHYSRKEIEDPRVVEYLSSKEITELNVFELVYSRLAFEWFEKRRYNFTRSDVVKVIEEVSWESGLTNCNLELTQIILNSGILEPYASTNNQYAFSHLSIMEYFTALHVVYQENWRDFIGHNSGKQSWRNVILMLIGLLGKEKYEEVYKLLTSTGDYFQTGMILAVEGANELEELPDNIGSIVNDVYEVVRRHPFKENLVIDLAHKGGPVARNVMKQLLKDGDKTLKLKAIKLAHFFNDEAMTAELLAILTTSDDREIRETAIYEMGYRGDEEAVDYLVQIVRNKKNDDSIRSAALDALDNIGDASGIEEAMKILKSKVVSCDLKKSAVGYLNPSRSEKELEMLLKILGSEKDDRVRWPVIHKLAECKSDAAIGTLEKLLKSSTIMDGAVYALAGIGTEKANRILLDSLKKEGNLQLRMECARVAAKMESVEAEESLLRIASGNEPAELRRVAVEALEEKTSKNSLDKVLNLLDSQDEDIGVRGYCVFALAKRDPKRCLERCIHYLKSEEAIVLRRTCASALGIIGVEKGIECLVEVLTSPKEDGELRKICAKSLGEIRSEKAIGALKKAATMKDNDRRLRLVSVIAMWQIGGEGGEYAIKEALGEDRNWQINEIEEMIDKYPNKCNERTLTLMIEGYKRMKKGNKANKDKLLKRLLDLIHYYSMKHDRVILPEELCLTSEV